MAFGIRNTNGKSFQSLEPFPEKRSKVCVGLFSKALSSSFGSLLISAAFIITVVPITLLSSLSIILLASIALFTVILLSLLEIIFLALLEIHRVPFHRFVCDIIFIIHLAFVLFLF